MTPLVLFGTLYVATFLSLRFAGVPWNQWIGLGSVVVATAVSIAILERGEWSLGLGGPPRSAIVQIATGVAIAVLLIGATDIALRLLVSSRRLYSGAFPWFELAIVFVPAVVHEELLFRGYIYQKLRRSHRAGAILFTSVVFALLHAGNAGINAMAMVNLFLGGVLLAFAYEWRTSLWTPIGLHFAWNLMSGPVLGYAVSGFTPDASIFRTSVAGPELMTGGAFGIEGSICITVAEITAAWMLWRLNRRPT